VPTDLEGVTEVSAGGYFNLALKSDGTVVAWGRDDKDQCKLPKGLYNGITVSGGWNYSQALKSDGRVVAWGNNNLGQCTVDKNLNLTGELSGLTVSEGDLTPVFDSDILEYTVNVDNTVNSLDLHAAILADSSNQL